MSSHEAAFQQAAALHQAGRLQEAEQLYRSILEARPDHPEANHNLGMVKIQSKRPAAALPLLQAAIKGNPQQGRFRLSYVYGLLQAGEVDAARQALAQSLHLDLDRQAVAALSGVLANHMQDETLARQDASLAALFSEGRFAEAGALAEAMTARFPLYGKGWMALGTAGARGGDVAAAVEAFRKAAALMPDDVEAHFNLCIGLRNVGRLAEAEASCRRALALKPDFVEAHLNLGRILQRLGRDEAAEASFRHAISIAPALAEAHGELGLSLHAQGRMAEAEASHRRALEIRPDSALAHSCLGGVLKALGRIAEAEASYRRALEIAPESAPAHCDFGIFLRDLGRQAEAEASLRRAVEIAPDFADAHQNLGACLQAQGRVVEAEASFRRVLDLKTELADAGRHYASQIVADGDPSTGLIVILQSLAILDTEEARSVFVDCVGRVRFAQEDAGVRAALMRALTERWARPSQLVAAGVNLVKLSPAIRDCLARLDHLGVQGAQPSARSLVTAEAFAVLGADPLLRTLLVSTPLCDIEMERLLTAARRSMLEAACAPDATRTEGDAVIEFCSALASQCFVNEYVYAQSAEERRKAEELQASLNAALEAGSTVDARRLLALAAYVPLSSLPLASRLLDAQWPEAVAAVLTQQVREPEEERRLRESIPRLTGIKDAVSRRVRSQYEENPYPRWVNAASAGVATELTEYLRRKFPLAPLKRAAATNGVDVLIAGCGTGQHPIATSRQIDGARVLAIDLSMNSLGYAKRKSLELGVAGIEYAQADLMALASLGRSYDLIESVGVLHHLEDPWAGWRVLLSALRPLGILRLGLYSEVARRNIVKVRAYIAEKGYGATADDIRRCRQELLGPGTDADLRTVAEVADFFSTSECRDLLFHVQEHRTTLDRIDAFLRENRLGFVGFEVGDDVWRDYRQRFPDDRAQVDLDRWRLFENENPDTFIGMYKFWVQRLT